MHGPIHFGLLQKLWARYFENYLLLSKDILKVKYCFQHTILMKWCTPLAIIFHYTVQFNLECCKIFVPDMGPNAILKIKIIIIRRPKSEIKKSNLQSL